MNLLGLISHFVILPLMLYRPVAELSAFNPLFRALANGQKYNIGMITAYDKMDFLKSNTTLGEVCVYYKRMKLIRAKVHMIIAHLDDGSCVVYRYGPPNTGYYPLEEPIEHRFMAYQG